MPTSSSTFTFFDDFVLQLGKGNHTLNTDTIKVMLTNTAPDAAADTVNTDVTEITAEHGYSAGGVTLNSQSWTASAGVATFTAADEVLTASGGTIGPFRYQVYYNATSNYLIGYTDYGSSITLQGTKTFTLDHGSAIFTVG